MKSLSYYLKHLNMVPLRLLESFGAYLPDEVLLKLKFRLIMGKKLDLQNPKTFSEKLQWLKLYNRKPEYTVMVDKVKAKEYVASIIGDEYIIPTLGVWENPDQIDFNKLPERFVLKCNHNSGLGMYICRDKSKMDVEKVRAGLRKGLKQDYFISNREWPYKNVPRRILAERCIEPDPTVGDLFDYKFFCFNGEPKFCQVISGRGSNMCIDFFDQNWNHQPFHEPKNIPFANLKLEKPKQLEKMWEVASRLSNHLPFSRIDFYEVGDKVYFGEITFFPTSGMGGFAPEEWDVRFGDWIILPK